MPILKFNTVSQAVVTAVKTVADAGFPVVGPGEQDPDSGETDNSASIACFARVHRVTMKPQRWHTISDTHIAELEVVVLIIATDKGSDPKVDCAAELQSVIGVLQGGMITTTAASVRTEINLQVSQVTEQTPDLAHAARAIEITAIGQVKAETV